MVAKYKVGVLIFVLPSYLLNGLKQVQLASVLALSTQVAGSSVLSPYMCADVRSLSMALHIQKAAIQSAAVSGDGTSQVKLGMMHKEGREVAQSDAEAVHWFKAAAHQGQPFSLSIVVY